MLSPIVCTVTEVHVKQLLCILLVSAFPYPRLSKSITYCCRIVIADPLCRCVTAYCMGDGVSHLSFRRFLPVLTRSETGQIYWIGY